MYLSGVFQVDREIFENRIWSNVSEFRIFFYILGNAVWSKEGVWFGDVLVGRGQYLRSYRNLREDLMYMENNAIKYYSISHIKKVTDKLVVDGRLKKEETELGTLFTIVNYSKYQWSKDVEKDNREQSENGVRTEQEQNENNNNKDNKVNKDNYIYSQIYDHWNSQKIIEHRKLTDKMKTKIRAALKDNELEVIINAISTYSEIIKDDKYYFTYKWTLEDFLQRGLNQFIDAEVAKANYLSKSFKVTTPAKSKTKFHTEENRTDKYSADELEKMAERKRREWNKKQTERMEE